MHRTSHCHNVGQTDTFQDALKALLLLEELMKDSSIGETVQLENAIKEQLSDFLSPTWTCRDPILHEVPNILKTKDTSHLFHHATSF